MHLDLDFIRSFVFGKPMILILAPYLEFGGAEKIHVFKVLIWGSGGCWRFLTQVLHVDLDLDIFTGL